MIKKLTYATTDAQRTEHKAVFRGGKPRDYIARLVNLHRAQESAAALRGSPDELDSAEFELVLRAAKQMLARDPRTDYAGILEEMDQIRRHNPPPGVPRKENWLHSLFRFNRSSEEGRGESTDERSEGSSD